jgi:aminomethyltransferase
MIEVNHSEIGNTLKVSINDTEINCIIVEKPFYDPKKKIASS